MSDEDDKDAGDEEVEGEEDEVEAKPLREVVDEGGYENCAEGEEHEEEEAVVCSSVVVLRIFERRSDVLLESFGWDHGDCCVKLRICEEWCFHGKNVCLVEVSGE